WAQYASTPTESDRAPRLVLDALQGGTLNGIQGRIRKCAHETDAATKMIETALGWGRMQSLLITRMHPATGMQGPNTAELHTFALGQRQDGLATQGFCGETQLKNVAAHQNRFTLQVGRQAFQGRVQRQGIPIQMGSTLAGFGDMAQILDQPIRYINGGMSQTCQ